MSPLTFAAIVLLLISIHKKSIYSTFSNPESQRDLYNCAYSKLLCISNITTSHHQITCSPVIKYKLSYQNSCAHIPNYFLSGMAPT